MDPNETLKWIRELAEAVLVREDAEQTVDEGISPEAELAECIQNLDEWLSKGGFLPDAWVPVSCPECRMRRTHTPDCSQR